MRCRLTGDGPLVVLSPGIGDLRQSYRFLTPLLVKGGYRVTAADMRGHGASTMGWQSISRSGVAGDLLALIRQIGAPPSYRTFTLWWSSDYRCSAGTRVGPRDR